MARYKVDTGETYRGVPVQVVAMMYDYVKEHGGTFDGDYARGFVDGVRYGLEKYEEQMEKELFRHLIGGSCAEGIANFRDVADSTEGAIR